MTRIALLPTLLLFCAAAHAPAQTSAVPPAAGPGFTLQTDVRRVYVDVVVTDRKGHPVPGLTKENFQVFEDGTVQSMRGFDVHTLSMVQQPQPPLKPQTPPNTFTNLVRAPPDSPITVILYDVLNTPLNSLPYAHEAIVKFVKAQKSSTRIAIFVLSDKLYMVQGFTDDETRLLSAINSKAARTQQSGALQTDTTASDATASVLADLPVDSTSILSQIHSLETAEDTYLLQQRLEITVNAFAQIAHFVSTLPGRKSLIWLSGSFPSAVLPSSDPAANGKPNEFTDSYSLTNEVKEAEDLLNLNHVAVYPVDARGLQVDPQFSAASNAKPGLTPKISTFHDTLNAEHGTMDDVADSTGGHAFYNTNGLQQAMQSAQEEGSSYYTITYAPTNTKQDGTLRHIKVNLNKYGYELSYRRSYYADGGAHPLQPVTAKAAAAQRDLFLDAAMQHGAPIAPDLFFETDVEPVGVPMAASPSEMEKLKEFLATRTKHHQPVEPDAVKVQHYEVSFAVLGRQLKLPQADNDRYSTDMTFALGAYAPSSELVNGIEVNIKNQIPSAQYQKIRSQGYHASMVFAVPVQASTLRMAVRDGIGGRLGTMEIPLPVSPRPVATSPPVKP